MDAHPIAPDIRAQIIDKLAAVERDEDVRVIYACESGSRGWGFASPDSDYDVRFIYRRPVHEYLRIWPLRDVIEEVPGPVFDVNGWDLRKALQLPGPVHTIFASANVVKTAPIKARDDGQTGRLA